MPGLALTSATIFPTPTDPPIHNATILIDSGKILAVTSTPPAPGTPTLDCSGCSITAGFWNSHVHFFERKWSDAASIPAAELTHQLEDMLTRFGFTTVFDLSSPWANTRTIRDRIASAEVAGPRILSTGEGMLPKDPGLPGDPVMNILGVMKTPPLEIADPAEARAAIRRLLNDGVDAIKLFLSAPSKATLSDAIVQAAVEEAHAAGKLVFVHPNNAADVLTAVRNGVDIIAHTTPYSGPWDSSLIAAMRDRNVALIPTLKIWMEFMRHDRHSTQEKIAETETAQLRAFLAAGGTVLFGTDISYVNYDPTEEYELMSRAGMTFPQILTSLTTAPAEQFGASNHLGRIAPGFDADLTILAGDPQQNLHALTAVRYTISRGRIVYRATN